MEIAGAGNGGHIFLSCIDQFNISIRFLWNWSHSQQAIFRMVDDLDSLRNMVSYKFGDPDPQINIGTIRQVLSGFSCHLIPAPANSLYLIHAGYLSWLATSTDS